MTYCVNLTTKKSSWYAGALTGMKNNPTKEIPCRQNRKKIVLRTTKLTNLKSFLTYCTSLVSAGSVDCVYVCVYVFLTLT